MKTRYINKNPVRITDISFLLLIFAMIPDCSGNWNHFYLRKGVIEIIFIDEILAKFLYAVKMVAVAPHHWFVQPLLASYISFGVGYCFIQQQGQCEKPHQ